MQFHKNLVIRRKLISRFEKIEMKTIQTISNKKNHHHFLRLFVLIIHITFSNGR